MGGNQSNPITIVNELNYIPIWDYQSVYNLFTQYKRHDEYDSIGYMDYLRDYLMDSPQDTYKIYKKNTYYWINLSLVVKRKIPVRDFELEKLLRKRIQDVQNLSTQEIWSMIQTNNFTKLHPYKVPTNLNYYLRTHSASKLMLANLKGDSFEVRNMEDVDFLKNFNVKYNLIVVENRHHHTIDLSGLRMNHLAIQSSVGDIVFPQNINEIYIRTQPFAWSLVIQKLPSTITTIYFDKQISLKDVLNYTFAPHIKTIDMYSGSIFGLKSNLTVSNFIIRESNNFSIQIKNELIARFSNTIFTFA
jgi:hypothetical protein